MMESPIQPHEAKTIYIQFSDTGRHIRKWSLKPFEGAIKYEAACQEAPEFVTLMES